MRYPAIDLNQAIQLVATRIQMRLNSGKKDSLSMIQQASDALSIVYGTDVISIRERLGNKLTELTST